VRFRKRKLNGMISLDFCFIRQTKFYVKLNSSKVSRMKENVSQDNFPCLLRMKENLRQNWERALVKFSLTKQEQTGEEDVVAYLTP